MKLYLARNKNGKLHLYDHVPFKCEDEWRSYQGYPVRLHRHEFPEITWDDAESTEVKLVVKNQLKSR